MSKDVEMQSQGSGMNVMNVMGGNGFTVAVAAKLDI